MHPLQLHRCQKTIAGDMRRQWQLLAARAGQCADTGQRTVGGGQCAVVVGRITVPRATRGCRPPNSVAA
jgi:hypothetical protein